MHDEKESDLLEISVDEIFKPVLVFCHCALFVATN
jgi:hypothetical protein